MAGHIELVADRAAVGRQAAALGPDRRLVDHRGLGLGAGVQGLAALAAVAIDRDGLEAQLPRLQVDVGHVLCQLVWNTRRSILQI